MPESRRFLTAEWRALAMLNYEVDPKLLAPHVPKGTELDTFDGVAYASMVGFLFLQTRVMGVPVPLHQDFEEVNLRFYVRRRAEDGWRRGVVFIKEIVPKYAIAALARGIYHENYVAMPMRNRVDSIVVEYGWRPREKWNCLRVSPRGEPALVRAGSVEEFITEHYWGYTPQPDGGTLEYRVEHVPWRVWQVSGAALECEVTDLYGAEFAEALSGSPRSAFLAEGSLIAVYRGVRLC
jgi:uncharacterized protein YqjF (DUF2071 family)